MRSDWKKHLTPAVLEALRLQARRFYRDWEFADFSQVQAAQRSRAKEILYLAQDGLCPLCGKTVDIRFIDRGWPLFRFDISGSLDHVYPRSRAIGEGYDRLGNFVLSHRKCNTKKGNRAPTACEIMYLRYVNSVLAIPTPFITLKGVDNTTLDGVSFVSDEESEVEGTNTLMAKKGFVEVVENATDKVVETLDFSKLYGSSNFDRAVSGLLRNMNTDDFHIVEGDED